MESKASLRNGMMGRTQRKSDKVYNKKIEEWNKMQIISNGKKSFGRLDVIKKLDEKPVKKFTKFFTIGY